MRFSEFAQAALALSLPLMPLAETTLVAGQDETSDHPVNSISTDDYVDQLKFDGPSGCITCLLGSSVKSYVVDNQPWPLNQATSSGKHNDNTEHFSASSLVARDNRDFTFQKDHDVSDDLSPPSPARNNKLVDSQDLGITQAASDLFSTVPLPTGSGPTWHKKRIDPQSIADQTFPTKQVRQITQAATDLFSTVPLPTASNEVGNTIWSKRQVQGTTDRFSTTPVPSPTRSHSRSGFTQGTTDRFSTTPVPSPTRSRTQSVTVSVSSVYTTTVTADISPTTDAQDMSLFNTLSTVLASLSSSSSDPTGWRKHQRQITQAATDHFLTVPLPTGSEPTW